jgi:hypothetical protein
MDLTARANALRQLPAADSPTGVPFLSDFAIPDGVIYPVGIVK